MVLFLYLVQILHMKKKVDRYSKFEIIRRLNSMRKKISNKNLKVGDRFIYEGYSSLLFKTDIRPNKGKYLCSDEKGSTIWIDGQVEVTRINGVVMELSYLSRRFKEECLLQGN